jgi:predicted ATPase
MTLAAVAVEGFRSVRKIWFPLRRLTVLLGANGVGKTNLYRALELLHVAATGELATEVARDGGLASILWAGERKRHEQARVVLGVDLADILADGNDAFSPTYELELGFRQPTSAAFVNEALVKAEALTLRQGERRVALMERKNLSVWARNAEGKRVLADDRILSSETALSTLGGVSSVEAVRQALANWRFYHSFRTDPDSPLRRPALAVTAPLLAADGSNLAAVFATLRFIREDSTDLDEAIDEAFPGARLVVPEPEDFASFSMLFPDLPKRPFGAHELSDGTLHFLALAGALLAYRLPPFIALNEPETSLHPSLIPALGQLIARAAERTQIWVVTHSRELADVLTDKTGVLPLEVIRRDDGATWIDGLSQIGTFADDED